MCLQAVLLCYHDEMVRTQIQLTEEQARRVKRLASERGVSMAAVVRGAVEALPGAHAADEKRRRAMSVVGRFSSGKTDVSEEHDRYLVEAFGE